jgi:peptidoglycan hydrolase-like protein with peptidoglycan-binding domain
MPPVGSGQGKAKEDINVRAVHGGVKAIQEALNRRGNYGLEITGRYDVATKDAARAFRQSLGEDAWGGVGPHTAKLLLLPDLQEVCTSKGLGEHWPVVCGVVQNESAWDPGAVGYIKPVDLGLAQINGDSHPDMSEKERLNPIFAFTFIVNYLTNAMRALDGNIDHAIASYNLGITGCKRWIAAGSPEMWTPSGSTPRNVPAYIERIKSACNEGNRPVTSWA